MCSHGLKRTFGGVNRCPERASWPWYLEFRMSQKVLRTLSVIALKHLFKKHATQMQTLSRGLFRNSIVCPSFPVSFTRGLSFGLKK
jgi:hypothetical protein